MSKQYNLLRMQMTNPLDLIDIHCHVLPGVDDGARNMEESLQLLKEAYRQGVRTVIATPHYSRRAQDVSRQSVQRSICEELAGLAREQIDPEFEVFFGQELFYHEELAERLKQGFGWTMADSGYVLVEFGYGLPYEMIRRGLRSLSDAGYMPILAHIERYPSLRQDGCVDELRHFGVCLQMNYDSLEGSFLNKDVRWCRKMVKDGMIDVLATDMHRIDTRPPAIDGPMKWLVNHVSIDKIRIMCYENPGKIIRNHSVH